MKREYTYSSFEEDLVENAGQDFSLPENYRYIRDRFWERHYGRLLYYIFGLIGQLYWRIFLRARFIGVEKLSSLPRDKGYFIYANHVYIHAWVTYRILILPVITFNILIVKVKKENELVQC